MKLNEKIILCRRRAGLSQMDLADLLGVSRQSVSKWETGEANPDVTKIAPMAKALGVTADWLLSEEGPAQEAKPEPTDPRPTAEMAACPEWVERLPKSVLRLVKKYGWIFGLRMAAAGLLFLAFGIFTRVISHRFFSGAPVGAVGGMTFDGVTSQASGLFDGFSAFAVLIGGGVAVLGLALAWALKKWGEKNF